MQEGITVIEGKTGLKIVGEKSKELTRAEIMFQIAKGKLFGSKNEPKIGERTFEPITNAYDTETLVKSLTEALKTGKYYYQELKNAAKNKVISEKEQVMFERAIEVIEGKRGSYDSLTKAIEFLTKEELEVAKKQKDQRLEDLYAREKRRTGKTQVLGLILRGIEAQLGPFGGDEIVEFHADSVTHIRNIESAVKTMAPILVRKPK